MPMSYPNLAIILVILLSVSLSGHAAPSLPPAETKQDNSHNSPTDDDIKAPRLFNQLTPLVVIPTITLAPEVSPIETGSGADDLDQGSLEKRDNELVARKKKIKLPKTSTTTTTISYSTSTPTSTATRSFGEGESTGVL
ncbi:hypothetical protein L486_08179 [Kwoniella mangroviensis CBS 10435]|uniref:RxLR effector protein n=1 Tax=Kwoniella mangroviensis CBS 10435 TaxID=1331196 RepID=A0A1B9IFC7_9TREE|nr:hypothetical protein L486_08179 [Kwoniella mangroviensis CBS 10435]